MLLTPTLSPKTTIVAGASANESQALDNRVNAIFGLEWSNLNAITWYNTLEGCFLHHSGLIAPSLSGQIQCWISYDSMSPLHAQMADLDHCWAQTPSSHLSFPRPFSNQLPMPMPLSLAVWMHTTISEILSNTLWTSHSCYAVPMV